MSYIVNKTNGNVVTTIADGTIDLTSTSLSLIGRHYPVFGEAFAENFVKLLENFSNVSPPSAPLKGQLWFDSTSGDLNVNLSDNPGSPQWISSTKIVVGANQPVTFSSGTVWFNTLNGSLNVSSDGTTFTALKTTKVGIINPATSDSSSGDIFFNENENQVFVFSPNSRGTGAPAWDAVGVRYSDSQPTDIKDGELWFNSATKQLMLYSEAAGNNAAGSEVISQAFPKTITHGQTTTIGVELAGHPVLVEMMDGNPLTLISSLRFNNPGGTVNGINMGLFPATIEKGINLTTQTDDNGQVAKFNGPATSVAADIAEKFESDVDVEPGDLVKIGGSKDVTKTVSSLDQDVFGVVSTNPAYMMNSGLGDGAKYPYIALNGRVPVKVVGVVKKGQRLVSSSTPGVARAIENTQVVSAYVAVFGRALESSDDIGVKLVDAVVGAK